ncbi:prevent-host-death family protein [Nakamurella sp. UYEF19]|uniref:type II toxin-antitoxin system Phd/YefM family antitoxin n=1 Tax=Nakamurella sp. UYEF19 TaxID=1756392 RepID=UPI00339A02DF
MSTCASDDLRNDTADLLRRVAADERVTIMMNGAPVADLIPLSTTRTASSSREDLVLLLTRHQADAALRSDLDALASDTANDLEAL